MGASTDRAIEHKQLYWLYLVFKKGGYSIQARSRVVDSLGKISGVGTYPTQDKYKRSPRRYPALLTPNGKNSARARHTGQEGYRGALLFLVWAPTGSIGARTGRAVVGTSESQK
jgi:hypothetical protein